MVMREPSKKQISFAQEIRHLTGIELPDEFSAQAYWKYIDANKLEYEKKKRQECEYWSRVQAEDREKKAVERRRRDSEWAAANLYADTFKECVKNGEYDKPFLWH